MTFLQWAEALAALSVVIGFAGAIIGWIFKKYADSIINKLVKEYLSELKPNGGSSFRDQVNGLREDIKDIQADITNVRIDVSHLQGRFAQHLAHKDDAEVW